VYSLEEKRNVIIREQNAWNLVEKEREISQKFEWRLFNLCEFYISN